MYISKASEGIDCPSHESGKDRSIGMIYACQTRWGRTATVYFSKIELLSQFSGRGSVFQEYGVPIQFEYLGTWYK
jgi:hypothetical protein